jgi:hypothetical protein
MGEQGQDFLRGSTVNGQCHLSILSKECVLEKGGEKNWKYNLKNCSEPKIKKRRVVR